MTSLEELNNIVQSLQQTIQQQQDKINALEKQAIEHQQDILIVENNLANTQKELAQTKHELQESKLQQNASLEAQIQRFNALIDNLKNSEGKTLKFACGSTKPGDNIWIQNTRSDKCLDVYIDTKSAGFTETPYYFTTISGNGCQSGTTGVYAIYNPTKEGFMLQIQFRNGNSTTWAAEVITPDVPKQWGWYIQWLAVGI